MPCATRVCGLLYGMFTEALYAVCIPRLSKYGLRVLERVIIKLADGRHLLLDRREARWLVCVRAMSKLLLLAHPVALPLTIQRLVPRPVAVLARAWLGLGFRLTTNPYYCSPKASSTYLLTLVLPTMALLTMALLTLALPTLLPLALLPWLYLLSSTYFL